MVFILVIILVVVGFALPKIFTQYMSQEKNADFQKQLSMTLYSGKHKSQKINDRKDSDSTSVMVSQESPGISSLIVGGLSPLFSRKKTLFQEGAPYTF